MPAQGAVGRDRRARTGGWHRVKPNAGVEAALGVTHAVSRKTHRATHRNAAIDAALAVTHATARKARQTTKPREHHRGLIASLFTPAGGSGFGGKTARKVGRTAGLAASATGEAFYRDPIGVTGRTTKGLGLFAAGVPAALAGIGIDTVKGIAEGDPTRGARNVVKSASKGYSEEYGGIFRGDPGARKALARKIEHSPTGASQEIVDLATILAPEGGVLGRGIGRVGRAHPGSRVGRVVSGDRPRLRTSGNLTRRQDLGENFFRAAGQRAEDAARARRQERRNKRATEHNTPLDPLQPGEGEVVPFRRGRGGSAGRMQRRDVSAVGSRGLQSTKAEQRREVDQGYLRELGQLSRPEKRAVYAVGHGIVTDPARATEQLTARQHAIHTEVGGRKNAPSNPRILRPHRELAMIDYLLKHSTEAFTPKVVALVEKTRGRQRRTESGEDVPGYGDPALRRSTAEARVMRPPAIVRGIPYPYEVERAAIASQRVAADKARKKGLLDDGEHRELREQIAKAEKDLEARKPQIDRDFAEKVGKALDEEGGSALYFPHQKRPIQALSDRVVGRRRAVQGPKQSDMELFRTGRANTDPTVIAAGLLKNIKRKHQWRVVTEIAERHSFPHLREEPLEVLRDRIEADGMDPTQFGFINPGLAAVKRIEKGEHATGEELGVIVKGSPNQHGSLAIPEEYRHTQGWSAVPLAVAKELESELHPSGGGGRALGKFMGSQSSALLGLNPTWLQGQILAEGAQAVFATRGNIKDLTVGAHSWWKDMTPEGREFIGPYFGIGVGRAHGQTVHMGSQASGEIANAMRAFGQTPLMKAAARFNPVELLFRADDAKGRAFRQGVAYNKIKREALKDIGRNMGAAAKYQAQLANVFRAHAKGNLKKAIDELSANPEAIERAAEHTDRMMGDFTRYTAFERKVFKRAVLFYGFMRYSVKFLFYTLPVGHPIAASLGYKLGQLHHDEVVDLLGGDAAPWSFGRVLFQKDGKIESIDLARINPLTNPVTDVAAGGIKASGRLLSPIAQGILNQMYGRDVVTHAEIHSSVKSFLDDVGSALYPYRTFNDLDSGKGDLKRDLFPFIFPKPEKLPKSKRAPTGGWGKATPTPAPAATGSTSGGWK